MGAHACDRPASEGGTGIHIMTRNGTPLPIQCDTRRTVRGGELDVEKRFGIEILTGKGNDVRSAFDDAGAVELLLWRLGALDQRLGIAGSRCGRAD